MRILVVGSGLLGITTSYFLIRYGHEVVVVDRAEGPGMETSFANGGMLTPSQADPWNSPGVFWKALSWLGKEDAPLLLRPSALLSLSVWGPKFLRNSAWTRYTENTLRNVRLASYAVRMLRAIREETGIDYDQASRGTMKIFREQQSIDQVVALAAMLSDYGVNYRVLDSTGAVNIEPALAPIREKLAGAIHYTTDESGDAHKFCLALTPILASQGVQFHFNTTVSRFQYAGSRLSSAVTTQGRLEAEAFVITAGSYSPLLVKSLGIKLPIKPVKGYSITLPRGDWHDGPRLPIVDESLHAAVTPLGERIRVAGTAEFAGFDKTLTESRIKNLFSLLRQVFPDYASKLDESQAERWMGFRPMTVDGVPILGKSSFENLYFNTGHGHLGWSMSAGSAKAVADLITGKTPEIELSDYSLDRF